MTKRRSVALVLGVVVLSVLGAASPASAAEDRKNYPGAMCRAIHGTNDESVDDYYTIGYEGWFFNVWTSAVEVVCPVVQDCGQNYGSGHWIAIRDDHTSLYATMWFEIRTGTGSSYVGSATYSSGASTAPAVYTSLSSPTNAPSYSYVTIRVTLPGKESGHLANAVVGYSVDENC